MADGEWKEETIKDGIEAMRERVQSTRRTTVVVTRVRSKPTVQPILVVGQTDGAGLISVWGGGAYRGVLVVGREDGNAMTRKAVAKTLHEMGTQTGTVVQPGWIYGPELTMNHIACDLPADRARMDAYIKWRIGADASDLCGVISGVEEKSQQTIMVIGRTSVHAGEDNNNAWVMGMYGPVVVTGGERHANGGYSFYEASGSVVEAYMEWLRHQPAELVP